MLNERFGVGGDLVYHTFGGNDDLEKELSAQVGSPVDFTFSLLQFGAHGRFFLPTEGTLAPYVQLGLSLYHATADGAGSSSSTPFGFSIGVGADIKKGESYSYGVQGDYHQISSSDASGDNATNMITLGVHAGFGIKK